MQHLILLHGAIGAKDQLTAIADELRADFNVHLLNFSGHGGDPFPQTAFSIELFAENVLQYIKQHGISTANIFGYSMGGYVGMYLAKNFPAKINKLVTLATKFYWDETIAANEAKMLDAEKIEQKIPAFAKQLATRHSPNNWKEVLSKTKELLLALGSNNVLRTEDYSTINISSLLLLGDRDKMVTLEETVAVYKQLPNASFAVLPSTPHPVEQADVRLLCFLIKRFLTVQ